MNPIIPLKHAAFCFLLLAITNKSFSQRDTLRLYYQGLQTKVLDSNDVKIGEWAKKLKGKHVDVEIRAYYDASDFKKYIAERAEEVEIVVIRKARDFVTVTESGPVKGKKWQRTIVDIVYTRPPVEQPPEENKTPADSTGAK